MTTTESTDFEIVQTVQQGDCEAFAELIRRYQTHVLRHCLSMLLNRVESEDAAQDVFLKAYRSIEKYQTNLSFPTWLSRIATNHCLDLLRKRKRHKMDSLDGLIDQHGEQAVLSLQTASEIDSDDQDPHEKLAQAMKAMTNLSDDQRQILTLRELDGLRYDEIAQLLKCSLDAVKARLRRAREALQSKARHFPSVAAFTK